MISVRSSSRNVVSATWRRRTAASGPASAFLRPRRAPLPTSSSISTLARCFHASVSVPTAGLKRPSLTAPRYGQRLDRQIRLGVSHPFRRSRQPHLRWSSTTKTTTKTVATSAEKINDEVTQATEEKTTTTNPLIIPDKERQMQWRILSNLGGHLWPSDNSLRRQRVVASFSLMMLGKGVTIQVPYIFKHLVDALPAATLTTTDPVTTVPLALLLGYGVARASSVGLHEWRNAIFAHVAQDAIRQVGRQVFDHVHRLDLSFHLSRNTGQVARILDRGQRSISMVLNAMVFHVLPTIFEVSLVTGLLAYQFGAAHSIVILGTISSYLAFTIAMTQWRTKFRRDMVRLENQASGQVVDSLMNYETVRYFNNQQHEGERYEKSLRGYQLAALDAQSSLSWLNFGQAVIFSTGLTAVMGLTAQQVLSGTATPGDLVLVNGLLFQLSVPLFFIGGVYREVRQALIDMEAMFQLRDTKPNIVDPTEAITYDASTMGTEMQLENVHFAYPTAANKRPILQGSNLTIPHGKTVAFVGASGCGKSTVLRLLYRFYDPDKGRLTIGGQDLRDLDQQSLQKSMAVVPQDTVLFHESIGYNIQYGNLDAPWEEVVDAAKKAHIHDTIMSFPDGYDTIVGERGLKLSGGEKQRVAIARAMLKDSPILLCDEPTSSLDSQTETEIMNNLKSIGKDRTTIIIAHRLSTIQDCDEIVVWSMGQVVEKGTHEELVRLGGRYTELLRMQETIPDS